MPLTQECCSCESSEDFTDDAILNGRILIRQPRKGYRVAMDPMVLASQVNVQENQKVLDVGCGVGAISLILKSRVPSASITSIDINRSMCDLCRYNSQKNGLDLDVQNMDLETFCASKSNFNQRNRGSEANNFDNLNKSDQKSCNDTLYDHVVTNPPFFKKESSRISEAKLVANFETLELSRWICLSLKLLKPHGIFSMIHEPSRIFEILAAIKGRAGSITIIPVYSHQQSEKAVRIIVQCVKGSKEGTKIMKGIIQG